jgi:hypothetical protein
MALNSPEIATAAAAAIAILHAANGLAHKAMHYPVKVEIGRTCAANLHIVHQDSLSFARV